VPCAKIKNNTSVNCVYAAGLGAVRKQDKNCYLPNAAIAWKQPNGFFYPPSFHSTNLFFGKVAIRHYVIDALFQPTTYKTDTTEMALSYCVPANVLGFPEDAFTGFTDLDRQTELNDDDGTLTGLTNNLKTGTISVNPALFFGAPLLTAECLSNVGILPKL